MNEIPTPHLILCLGDWLERRTYQHLYARFPMRHLQPILTPHAVNPFEIYLPTTLLQKSPGKATAPLFSHPLAGPWPIAYRTSVSSPRTPSLPGRSCRARRREPLVDVPVGLPIFYPQFPHHFHH